MTSSPGSPELVSDLLRQLRTLVEGGGTTVTVGQMLDLFGRRGFALLFFVLALMNIAIFMLPGVSILFGLPMLILAVQMALGSATPVFPAFVRNWTVERAALAQGLDIGIRGVRHVEPLIRPRYLFFGGAHMDRLHSLLAVLLALGVAIPIPFLNIPPTFGMLALAVGFMQRDGAFLLAAYGFGAASLTLYLSLGSIAQKILM